MPLTFMDHCSPERRFALMASAFGLSTASSGTMAMISTIGYSAGLFFIVPLADLVENRRLITYMLTCASLCATGVVLAPNAYESRRTSARRVLDEPTRSNSPVSTARSNLACCTKDRLPISSRKSVPPSASSNRPVRSLFVSAFCICECTFHMTEQFTFKEVLAQSTDVHRNQGLA
jgi:hypothetical protein